MSTKDNWKQAQASIINPLIEPTPDQDTGLNSSFVPVNLPVQANTSPYAPVSQQNTGASSSSNNPFRRTSETPKNPYTHSREISSGSATTTPEKNGVSSHVRNVSSGMPSKSGVSSHVRNVSTGSASRERFADNNPFHDSMEKRRSIDKGYRASLDDGDSGRPRRSSSLRERFPGDPSVRPLDAIRKEERKANHAPHLQKRHLPGADTIDSLDTIIGPRYHHEGPYDATLLARNTSYTSSPVAAVQHSNEETLKATPAEAIKDAVERHRPLDNTAIVPPGETDQFGRRYSYEEGDNMNIAQGGNLKRWEGVDYKDDDIKGVGEPTFSIEKRLRERGSDRPDVDGDHIELVEQTKGPSTSTSEARSSGAHASSSSHGRYADWEDGVGRKSSISGITDGLKKRLSIRKKKDT